MARVFLDTNIFLYAIGGPHAHKEACRDVLTAVGNGTLDGVTSSEVLQEVLHVRSLRAGMKDGIEAVRMAAALVAEVLPVTGEDILSACKVLAKHPQIKARDAIHIAVMKANHLPSMISTDKDFDAIKEVRRVAPEDAL